MQRVHIEFQRVQTWLFAVPRLRAMVGANALLGRALRVALPDLARQTGCGWALAPSHANYPSADPNDPLKDYDDPAADAKAGILSRDGGHFEARFSNGASEFAAAAANLLRSCLPGLRFRISIDGAGTAKNQVHLSTELPVLAPCEWTGRGLASAIVKQGSEQPIVSPDVAQRHQAATQTEDGTAVDLASLLSARTKLQKLERPQELKELVGNGYLALIHADGNGIGSGAGKTEAERAAFFHRNRVLLRRALQQAIDRHCPNAGLAPLILLMLGGDDILLVTRAEIALPFVVTLCTALDALQGNETGFKLTLGIGVVIARHTIPVHRLHEVAEQLTSSAKHRFRGFTQGEKNTPLLTGLCTARRGWTTPKMCVGATGCAATAPTSACSHNVRSMCSARNSIRFRGLSMPPKSSGTHRVHNFATSSISFLADVRSRRWRLPNFPPEARGHSLKPA